MSVSPVRTRRNINGRSRSPSPTANSAVRNVHDRQANSTSARNNFFNPENSNLYRARRNIPNSDIKDHRFPETIPLIETENINPPPLANPEVDDLGDDRPTVTLPYPGIDDGFFENRANEDGPSRNDGTDVSDVEPIDGVDGGRIYPSRGTTPRPHVPMSPTDGYKPQFPDVELGAIPDLESIPDINVYQHKKTLAQGMMDLALFSANANQLRYVLESDKHPYYYPGVILISISLLLQVAVGVGLIWNARYNVKDEKEICIANKINNSTVIGIFLVTVINVFISAFGVASVQPVIANAP